jgi:hypothetical protein
LSGYLTLARAKNSHKEMNMTKSSIVVREHDRRKRSDRVGDMLRSATALRTPRTLRDFAIQYSRNNDNPDLPADDAGRFLWHLDPVELRSVVTQAQARMRVGRDPVILYHEDGTPEEVEAAVKEGEFVQLISKLRPSMPEEGKKPGRVPLWCGDDFEPLLDKEPPVDGLGYPAIIELIAKASAAGDTTFVTGNAVHEIAKKPKRTRALIIEEKSRDYSALIMTNARLNEANKAGQRKDAEILRLATENKELNKRVLALEDKMGVFADIDFDALPRKAEAVSAHA